MHRAAGLLLSRPTMLIGEARMRLPPPLTTRLLCLALATALACPAFAGTGEETVGPPLRAVGWLGYGQGPRPGKANCSGVLIAPDLVVTADHCLTDSRTGKPARAESLTFIAGLAGTTAAATRRGRAIWIAPGEPPDSSAANLGPALGLLLLDRPVSGAEAAPVPLAPLGPAPGMTVVTVGYPRTAQDRPVVQVDCRVTLHAPPVFGLDCEAVSGFSGGAVLAEIGGVWMLEAIMVAEARRATTYRAIVRGLPAGIARQLQP